MNDLVDILENYVWNDDIEKTVDEVRQKYMKSSLYDLIQRYLKAHPYAHASVFGL